MNLILLTLVFGAIPYIVRGQDTKWKKWCRKCYLNNGGRLNDANGMPEIMTLEECKQRCEDQEWCTSISYGRKLATGLVECYHDKEANPLTIPTYDHYNTHVIKDKTTKYQCENGKDIGGADEDYKDTTTNNWEDCRNACQGDPGCDFFVWGGPKSWKPNGCWLKKLNDKYFLDISRTTLGKAVSGWRTCKFDQNSLGYTQVFCPLNNAATECNEGQWCDRGLCVY